MIPYIRATVTAMPERVIGRERELDAVRTFVADLERGVTALVFAGEAGIGKTAIWEEAVERRLPSSVSVLSARPVEAEAALAFSTLADLLHAAFDNVAVELPDPQRRALAVALLREDPGEGWFNQRAVAAAACATLRKLARKGRVVLAVDDLQWVDPSSARVLEFALRRLHDVPLGVIASQRVQPGERPPLLLERAVPESRLRRVDVGPLEHTAVGELLTARLGRRLTRRVVDRIVDATGGNPFYALEVARSLPEGASGPFRTLPMTDRLVEVVGKRIGVLSLTGRRALVAAASLRAATVEVVAVAAGMFSHETVLALEEAESHGIITIDAGRVRFSHPLFAEVVYASAPAADRRAVHRRIATVTPEVEERAQHAALGADGPGAPLTATIEAGAHHARARGAPEIAVDLLEWVLRLTPPEDVPDVQRRTVEVAELRFHAGDLQAARQLLEGVLEDTTGPVRGDVLRLLGEIRYHEDSFPDALAHLSDALGCASEDPRLGATVELRLSFILRAMGEFDAADPHTRRALVLAQELGDDAVVAEALALVARQDFLQGRGLDQSMVDRSLALEDTNRPVAIQMRPSKIAGDLLLYDGQLERAVRILGEERQRALDRGDDADLPFILGHLTWAECWRGNLTVAAAHAQEALAVANQLRSETVRSVARAFAALVAAHRGDFDDARAYAAEALALAGSTGGYTPGVWARWALGAAGASLGEAEAVDAALEPLTTAIEAEGLLEPVRAVFLADEIEALVVLGHLERAERLLDMLAQAGDRLGRGWAQLQAARCRALLLAARGDLDEAAATVETALAGAERVELRIEMARTCLVAGQIERRRRRKANGRGSAKRRLARAGIGFRGSTTACAKPRIPTPPAGWARRSAPATCRPHQPLATRPAQPARRRRPPGRLRLCLVHPPARDCRHRGVRPARRGRAWFEFEAAIRDHVDLGRPDRVKAVFARGLTLRCRNQAPGAFSTPVITPGTRAPYRDTVHDGQRAPALRFGEPRPDALLADPPTKPRPTWRTLLRNKAQG